MTTLIEFTLTERYSKNAKLKQLSEPFVNAAADAFGLPKETIRRLQEQRVRVRPDQFGLFVAYRELFGGTNLVKILNLKVIEIGNDGIVDLSRTGTQRVEAALSRFKSVFDEKRLS